MTPEAGGVANPVVWSERPWEGTTDQPAKQEGTQDRGRKALASAPHPPGGEGRAAATARRILSYHRTGGGVWSCSDVGRVPWSVAGGSVGGETGGRVEVRLSSPAVIGGTVVSVSDHLLV